LSSSIPADTISIGSRAPVVSTVKRCSSFLSLSVNIETLAEFHLACSVPLPSLAYASSFTFCPGANCKIGILSDALRNYLLRLGWSFKDKEIFTLDESIKYFSLSGVGKSPSKLDMSRILSMNETYIKNMSEDKLYSNLIGYCEIYLKKIDNKFDDTLKKSLHFLKNKAKTLGDIYNNAQYIINDQIKISDETQKFISSEIKTNIRELTGALNRIASYSRIYNKEPNLSEIKIILKDLLNLSENIITIDLIQSTVCKFFKISKNEMLSPRRSRYLVRPRQVAIYLTKILTSKSLPEIGREFSNRDHTTIIHSVKTIEKLKNENSELSSNIDNLKNQILYIKQNEV